MDKSKYNTSDYKWKFECIVCGQIWYYAENINPLVCAACERAMEVKAEHDKYEAYLKESENQVIKMNTALEKFYFPALKAQLNENVVEFTPVKVKFKED